MIPFDLQGRADHLATILEAVQQSQQTGIMNVQRGKGGVSEKGIIYFLYGEAVDAEVGERKGVEAWNWLKTWNSCQYIFAPKSPAEIPLPSPPAAEKKSSNHKITSPLAFVAQMLPKGSSNGTTKSDSEVAHPVPPARPIETPPARPIEQLPFTPAEPVQAPAPRVYNTPPSLPTFLPPAYNPPSYNPVTPITPAAPTYHVPAYEPASRVPFRLLHGAEALSYIQKAQLTRQHRHIFFLLDGQRTIDDLTRLTGHHITETLRLLADLERIGLIRQE
jgi:hypothetical protein